MATFLEISPEISHSSINSAVICKCRVMQKLINSSVVYHKTKSPFGTKIYMDISLQREGGGVSKLNIG